MKQLLVRARRSSLWFIPAVVVLAKHARCNPAHRIRRRGPVSYGWVLAAVSVVAGLNQFNRVRADAEY